MILGVTLEEDVSVRNLKPAVVKVYDYYQTSRITNRLRLFLGLFIPAFSVINVFGCTAGDEALTEYTSSCAESKCLFFKDQSVYEEV